VAAASSKSLVMNTSRSTTLIVPDDTWVRHVEGERSKFATFCSLAGRLAEILLPLAFEVFEDLNLLSGVDGKKHCAIGESAGVLLKATGVAGISSCQRTSLDAFPLPSLPFKDCSLTGVPPILDENIGLVVVFQWS